MSLTPLPSCGAQESCDPKAQVKLVSALIGQDPLTSCEKVLGGFGIPLADAFGTSIRDGSVKDPIKLPFMQQLEGISVPFIMIMNAGGTQMIFPAYTGPTKKVLFSHNGSWVIGNMPSQVCYDDNDVCADCDSTYIAGFTEQTLEDGTKRLCLTKINPANLSDIAPGQWDDSNSVQILGDGSVANKFSPHVKLSTDEGNILEIRENGLYVACCDLASYHSELIPSDPIEEL